MLLILKQNNKYEHNNKKEKNAKTGNINLDVQLVIQSKQQQQ